MPSKKPVSLRPSSFGQSIEGLLLSKETPPRLPNSEMSTLDLHNDGISSVKEALTIRPIPRLNYRELSRYASRVALGRMQSNQTIAELRVTRKKYLDNKIERPERIRKYYDDILSGLSFGYRPFVIAPDVHVWFWDDSDCQAFYSLVSEAGLPKKILYCFVADALCELSGLGAIASDLSEDYKQGIRYINWLLSNYVHCADNVLL